MNLKLRRVVCLLSAVIAVAMPVAAQQYAPSAPQAAPQQPSRFGPFSPTPLPAPQQPLQQQPLQQQPSQQQPLQQQPPVQPYAPPQAGAPQYAPPRPGAPQYAPPQSGAPQYAPPQPGPQQFPQQPALQPYAPQPPGPQQYAPPTPPGAPFGAAGESSAAQVAAQGQMSAPPTAPPPAPGAGAATPELASEPDAAVTSVSQTQSLIDQQLKEVNDAADLDAATKKEALERLRNAAEWVKAARETAEKQKRHQAELESAPNELRDVKLALATPRGEPQCGTPDSTPLAEIEQKAGDAEARLKVAKELLVKREETIKRRGDRKAELTKVIPETEKAHEEAKKGRGAARDGGAPLETARRLEAEGKFFALEAQRSAFPLEAKRIDALAELATLQRDQAKREVDWLERESAAWQKCLTEARKRDSDRQAAKARRELQDADPSLRTLAKRNAELAERRTAIVALIEATSSELQRAKTTAEGIKLDYEKMEEKVKKAGNSTTIGLLLRRQREHLPALGDCRQRLRFVGSETPAFHLSLLELQDEHELLDERDAAIDGIVARLDSLVQRYDQAYVVQMVSDLLSTRDELLSKLIKDHEEYLRLLSELEVSQKELIAITEKSQTYIDERVLWIRSSDPISLSHFQQAWDECRELARPAPWAAVAESLQRQVLQQPLFSVLGAIVVMFMVLCRDRFRRQVNLICESTSEELQARFWPTLQAVGASALATAFWPALTWMVGWQMQAADQMPNLGLAVGLGLQSAAYPLWLCRFTRQICRRSGVAERHFEWNQVSVALVRRNLTGLAFVGVPCVFFVSTMSNYGDGEWSFSLGRVGFLAGLAALAAFLHFTFRVRRGVFREPCSATPGAWFCRLRHAFYFLAIGVPLALALLASLGYDYTAQHLATRLQATVSVVLAAVFGRAVALRWLAVRKHRFELARAAEAASSEGSSPESTTAAPPADETDADLRYLLRYGIATMLVVGGYFVWSDVTPALSILDKVKVWSTYTDVKQAVTDADGTRFLTSQVETPTTLKHLLLAWLLLGGTMIVARNLPALLQALVLEHMPIDRGQRYAAGMILRYLISLAGLVIACRTIGLTWSSIQWLAAAMTVGLGFGLQEIFANLVSGLIILFERPIRVGDLVTVAGVTGRVTRMQIRATTITDFDRRELIVPNKKFITEDVMNWTLTDDVNRVVIEIGVAYGSDTRLARELLLKTARRHPMVLADPEPVATFDKFGDSSLNLTLRCFLPNLDNRLAVIDQLHSDIDLEFRAAGIEIAFPQHDLHVRTIDAPLRRLLGGERKQAA